MIDSRGELAAYERESPIDAAETFRDIGVEVHVDIATFYSNYEGGFASTRTGIELLPLSAVLSDTLICREQYHFPTESLVISALCGNAVYVVNSNTSAVYNVDFEGSDQEFVAGTLPPEHQTFREFVAWYFGRT